MAITFDLRWGATTVNMAVDLDNDDGITVLDYQPAVGDVRGRPVIDTMKVTVAGLTDDALATYVQSIDQMRDYAIKYLADPTWEDPVWLHAKMAGETGERRSLVRAIEMAWDSNPLAEVGKAPAHRADYILRVEREAYWEDPSAKDGATLSESAGTILGFDYTTGGGTDLDGEVRGRLRAFVVRSDASGAEVARLWMGFRSADKHGTLSNFAPIWECEDGTHNVSESGLSNIGDGAASGASKVRLIETDLDWDKDTNGGIFQEVLEITLNDISANQQDNFGDYLWLLRAQLGNNSTTWEVQLRWGYSSMADEDFIRGPIKEVTATSWDYFEMGRQILPLRDYHALILAEATGGFDDKFAVQIWARRTSGGANIQFDTLLLMPIDEGWLKSDGFSLPAASDTFWSYAESPEGFRKTAVAYDTGDDITHMAAFSGWNFGPPPGDGRLYIVYAGASDHDNSLGIYVTRFRYYERWLNLRGSE